jgi:hypothetical protein
MCLDGKSIYDGESYALLQSYQRDKLCETGAAKLWWIAHPTCAVKDIALRAKKSVQTAHSRPSAD